MCVGIIQYNNVITFTVLFPGLSVHQAAGGTCKNYCNYLKNSNLLLVKGDDLGTDCCPGVFCFL